MQLSTSSQTIPCRSRSCGFSLLELMVALAVFLIIGGVASNMFNQHVPMFLSQQSQVGLNFGLRNAVTQMQIDISNAGDGFYQGADTPGWPLGITTTNRVWTTTGPSCWNATTFVYSDLCFDKLTVIRADRNTPASHPAVDDSLSNSTDLYLTPVAPTTVAQLAGFYKKDDQILLVTQDGTRMTTAKLTANGAVSGVTVLLKHTATNANGTNNVGTNDDYQISTNADLAGLTNSFDKIDWVLKLAPVTYSVDTTDPNNPKLMRTQALTSTQPKTADFIAEQIIGFKVGVSLYNSATVTDDPYIYSVSSLTDFTKVRAIRISLIGRTPPNPANPFRNGLDFGPYKVEAASVVVNPRSMSMKD